MKFWNRLRLLGLLGFALLLVAIYWIAQPADCAPPCGGTHQNPHRMPVIH